MWTTIEYILIAYLIITAAAFIFQRRLMYHPVKSIAEPAIYGLTTVDEVFLASSDGTKLQTWTHAPRAGFPTILYFHGNAFHLADRAVKFSGFVDAGFGLVAVSYRGFGKSEGRPSEYGIYNDARAAIAYAIDKMNIAPDKLIYFGESLGTGVAIQMACDLPPALLVLEAAYTSVETRSAELYPYLLFARKMVRDKYYSLAKISHIKSPLLMFHGEKDAIIPIRHGRELFAAANEPKTFVVYPDVHHTDYTNEQLLVPLLDAARKYGLINPN